MLTRGASNLGLQGERLAGALNKTKDCQDGLAFDPTKMTGALKGEKEGDLGIDLDKSKTVNAIDAYHEQKRDKAQKEKVKAYQSQQKNALDAKLESVTSSDGRWTRANSPNPNSRRIANDSPDRSRHVVMRTMVFSTKRKKRLYYKIVGEKYFTSRMI